MRPLTTSLALIGAALAFATGTALAADVSTPVVCGSNGCMPLPTSTLHGLLTLPEALRPADPPPAQPFVLFRVADPDGATHQVVYVPRDGGALLGFAGRAAVASRPGRRREAARRRSDGRDALPLTCRRHAARRAVRRP